MYYIIAMKKFAFIFCAAFSLCAFSDAMDSIDAAVQVLFGKLKPQGKLPVRISGAYPFGYGLKAIGG